MLIITEYLQDLLKRLFASPQLIANCLTERQYKMVKYLEEIEGFFAKRRVSSIKLHFGTFKLSYTVAFFFKFERYSRSNRFHRIISAINVAQ